MRDHPTNCGRAVQFAAMTFLIIGMLLATGSSSAARDEHNTPPTPAEACAEDNGGITLPPGFCATVFADHIGHARHLVVAPNGVVYVNTWSGRYYHNDTPPPGGFLVALQDTTGDGRAGPRRLSSSNASHDKPTRICHRTSTFRSRHASCAIRSCRTTCATGRLWLC
jgi:glucose/arabinose dehydrogenase